METIEPIHQTQLTVSDLCVRLRLPNSPRPLSERNVRKYFEQLGITPVRLKTNGSGYSVNHVTEEQAQAVERLFRSHHWRKFKAAQNGAGN